MEKIKITASIHTISVRSVSSPNIPQTADIETIRSSYMQKTNTWLTRINPNKFNGDIFAYSEFCAVTTMLFREINISDCEYYRTDIRLDSYEDNFKKYYKLNLLLISLFSKLFNDSNEQAISHMLTQSKGFTDISTKNQYWEVKYYDKKFQTNDSDPAKARLEFRSLKTTKNGGYLPHEIKEIWFEKLNNLLCLYDSLQEESNKALLLAYDAYCAYNKKANSKRDLITNFFSTYSHSMTIFTRKQLKNFLSLCGVKEKQLEERTSYICSKTNIEFFSKNDLRNYIDTIKNSMNDFFLC